MDQKIEKKSSDKTPQLALSREVIKVLTVRSGVQAGREAITFTYCHSVHFGC